MKKEDNFRLEINDKEQQENIWYENDNIESIDPRYLPERNHYDHRNPLMILF